MPESDTERVMVDIETLGLEPGSAILSIGAVTFSENGLGDEFYREISLESCQEAGLQIDADTLEWWLSQDEAVTGVLTGGDSLTDVLGSFYCWFPNGAEVWANSPSFDCKHLEAALDAAGMTEPWEFRDQRDVRTLRSLPCAAEVEMNGDEHDALDDAKYQARIVSETLRSLRTVAPQDGESR
ncbi:3'-5' exonuclease [Halostella sp. PRR32]|uniref:3'-5' exonuclease n=1 Tax=Halostella sp. PRR32 TaxID=3098147 RepID=UPI002B1E3194|nr:3'-5' exonuclease [Halostella sp. PRR32]